MTGDLKPNTVNCFYFVNDKVKDMHSYRTIKEQLSKRKGRGCSLKINKKEDDDNDI